MSHDDFVQLQSHATDFPDKDRRDWLINLRFLRASLQQAQWPGEIWCETVLLDMVGRIASNNFGLYHIRQRQQFLTPTQSSQDAQASAVRDTSERINVQSLVSQPSASAQQECNEQVTACQKATVPLSFAQGQSGTTDAESIADEKHAMADTHAAVQPWPLQAAPMPSSAVVSVPAEADDRGSEGRHSTPDASLKQGQPDVINALPSKQDPSKSQLPGKKSLEHSKPAGRPAEKSFKEDVIGREMYITASFFNHSCEPNCVKQRLLGQQSGVATITALRDIKVNSGFSAALQQQYRQLSACVWCTTAYGAQLRQVLFAHSAPLRCCPSSQNSLCTFQMPLQKPISTLGNIIFIIAVPYACIAQ